MGSSKPLSSVLIKPFSMTPGSQETQWVFPISDHPIQTPLKSRLGFVLKEMLNITKLTMAIVLSTNQFMSPPTILASKLSGTNGFAQDWRNDFLP
jgi:hypothetical protein